MHAVHRHTSSAKPQVRIRYRVWTFSQSAHNMPSGHIEDAAAHAEMRHLFFLPISIKSGTRCSSQLSKMIGSDTGSVTDDSISHLLSSPPHFRSQRANRWHQVELIKGEEASYLTSTVTFFPTTKLW